MKVNWFFWAVFAYVAYHELKDWYQSWQLKKNKPKPYEQFLIDNNYVWAKCLGYERFYLPHYRIDRGWRHEIHRTIQQEPSLIVQGGGAAPMSPFMKWFFSPGGYAFQHCNNCYIINSKELLHMREDPEALLRQSMTEAEFFQFFLSGETGRGSDIQDSGISVREYWSLLIKHHGHRAMKEGFSPKALYAFLDGVRDIKQERNQRFFSRLASFMQAHIPDWGDMTKFKFPAADEDAGGKSADRPDLS
ncbi:MAG TPA: hypothetical protein PLD93_01515 [Synergistaceae bacterium]|nr:hypothetical protein [Synergistaceae bacterium]